MWTRDVLKLVRDYIKLHEKLRDAAQEKLIEGSWRKQTDDEIKLGRQTSSSSYKRWGDEFLKCLAAQKILDTALPPEPKGDAAPKKAATKKAATKKAATKKAATKSRGQARSQRGTQT